VLGGLATLYGAYKDAKSAKEQEAELARQRAANEAWYNRNYYQDYLNTVEAQNALKRVRDAWDERTRQERARQAITGGTAEQAQAVAEAGGEAMGEAVGNLAAQGQQNKAAIDAQKLAMDNNLSQQAAQIAENKQQAAQQLMAGGASMITSGLQAVGDASSKVYDVKGPDTAAPVGGIPTQSVADIELPSKIGMITSGLQAVEGKANKAASPTITTIDTAPGAEAAVSAGRETKINPTSYVAPMVTPETKITDEEARKLRGY
jgi:hypothetical protein